MFSSSMSALLSSYLALFRFKVCNIDCSHTSAQGLQWTSGVEYTSRRLEGCAKGTGRVGCKRVDGWAKWVLAIVCF